MKYKIIFFALSILLSNAAISQDFDNYKEICSTGTVPSDFRTMANDKFEEDITKISESEKRSKRKLKEQFYLESNFSVSEFLRSGNVLFNDPVSVYLNEIYENIKSANPFLKDEKIRFYTCKSTIVNAYAAHSGIIFINIGLIAKIKTEDELAYIMCHEISHFIENHNINRYTFNDKIDSNNGSYKEASWEKKLFSKSNYSQRHELIADSLGVIMYSNTNYCIKSPINALGNLKTYNSPLSDGYSFNKASLENNYISFPSINIVPLDSIVVKTYSTDDENSTHPDIDYRIDLITDQLASPDYFVDSVKNKTIPNKLQKLANFELPHLFLEKGMTIHALYCILSLLEENPNNKYLNEMKCNILYAISQNATCTSFNNDWSDIDDFKSLQKDYNKELKYSSAEIQQLNMFISKISNDQKNALAITELWSYLKDNKTSDVMMLRLKDLTKMKIMHYSKSNFVDSLIEQDSSYSEIISQEKRVTKAEIKKENDSKYENIKEDIVISNRISKNQTGSSNPETESNTEPETKNPDSVTENSNINNDDVYKEEFSTKKKKKNKDEDTQKKELGKVIFVTPEFRQFDLRKKNEYKYQASENAMGAYEAKISEIAKIVDIDHVVLSTLVLNETDTELINEIALINTFIEEKSYNSPWTMTSNKEEIQKLINKYNSEKIAFVGTYTFHMNTDVGTEIYSVIMSVFFPPVLPFTLWKAVTPEFRTFTYVLLYDLSTETVDYYDVEFMKMKGNEGVINTTMYQSFMKIKNQ